MKAAPYRWLYRVKQKDQTYMNTFLITSQQIFSPLLSGQLASKMHWHHTLDLFLFNSVHRHSLSDANKCWVCFSCVFLPETPWKTKFHSHETESYVLILLQWLCFTLRSIILARVWPHPARLMSTRCEDRMCRCACALIIWNPESQYMKNMTESHNTMQSLNFTLRLFTDSPRVGLLLPLPLLQPSLLSE